MGAPRVRPLRFFPTWSGSAHSGKAVSPPNLDRADLDTQTYRAYDNKSGSMQFEPNGDSYTEASETASMSSSDEQSGALRTGGVFCVKATKDDDVGDQKPSSGVAVVRSQGSGRATRHPSSTTIERRSFQK